MAAINATQTSHRERFRSPARKPVSCPTIPTSLFRWRLTANPGSGEAGLLIDGQVDARETAATIIDLAVRGALTVQSYGKDDFQVTLVDPNKAAAPHEMVLLTALFGGEPPGP